MTVVTIDSSNLEQVKADAGYVEVEPAKTEAKAEKSDEKVDAKEEKADKPAEKVDAKSDTDDDADDVEGEDGLTPRQRRDFTQAMQKTIAKKHRQKKEAEEFADRQIRERQVAERRANDAEEALQRMTPRQQAQEQVEPKREAFATESEYIDARVKWGVDLGIRQRDAQRAVEARQASVRDQYAKAAELVPDFEATVGAQLNYPGPVTQYMRESDMFAELGYHFAKNPKALEKLASLSPVRQLVELGKIEGTLQPFGSSASSPKAGDKPDGDKPPSANDTGFSPSKARSDAPVIKPLTGGEGSIDPDVRSLNTQQTISSFEKTKGVNLHARKRH